MIFKKDFYKAFDRVSWSFLNCLLQKFGFGSKWGPWLTTCWKTASFSILLNRSPRKVFKSSRGLRKGNPLSPLVFVLVVQVLTRLLYKAQRCEEINGFFIKEGGIKMHVLQFIDDTLIFTGGGLEGPRKVHDILFVSNQYLA